MSLPASLERLAKYRKHHSRASEDVYRQGVKVLDADPSLASLAWAFLEQLALAAIDIGQLDIADQCLTTLVEKFPGSPRVDVLTGIRMEASEKSETALKYYGELLETDPSNAAAWKRRITVLRTNNLEAATKELCQFVDTFYNDVEGWLELADIYSSLNQYSSALQALTHVLLLAPQNPFYFLQFAETAYTVNDVPLAFKMFLVVVDMCETDPLAPAGSSRVPTDVAGITTRAWWGVKLCSKKMLETAHLPSQSDTSYPARKTLASIDTLATDKLSKVYTAVGAGRHPVLSWL
ncbi:tetratricopeptide repeat domain 35 [Fistulina hepatica ATCC 64428]|uniref:ER membrane protein complex subunit 2 n=1 Tax=Fistulina hepatica ATCC 64428 TaxID=1128425 RepID=A0A0D7AEI6_9AGAR|nr:tetratricopeptide repeat domain 35 [Fistulina hepatica ATCC 64428]